MKEIGQVLREIWLFKVILLKLGKCIEFCSKIDDPWQFLAYIFTRI